MRQGYPVPRGWAGAALFAAAVGLVLINGGCATMSPVPTYNPSLSPAQTATLTLAKPGLWQSLNRPGEQVRVLSIDGQSYPEWVTAKILSLLPGWHAVRASCGGAVNTVTFQADVDGQYELRWDYSRGGLGGLQDFRLSLVDLKSGKTCASSFDWMSEYASRLDAARKQPLARDHARIFFTRKFNLLGAAVPHYVMDCGTGIRHDTKVWELSVLKANDSRMWIVRYIELPHKVVQLSSLHDAGYMAPNAVFMGLVDSGDTLVFDRLPGRMYLRTVTTGGDEGFAPEFTVDAGRSYEVDYVYGFKGVEFTCRPRP